MRVLLVTHYYPEHRGGIEIAAGRLAERLAARGGEIHWAASGPLARPLPAGLNALPMKTWNVAERRLGVPYPLWGPASLAKLVRMAARCDLVHLHDCLYLGNLTAFAAARLRRKPIVVTQHIAEVPYDRRWLGRLLRFGYGALGRRVLGGSDRAVFYSPGVRSYFEALADLRDRSVFIPNGVDGDLFTPLEEPERRRLRARHGLSPEAPVLLFVGRFTEKKGLSRLRYLAGEFPHCQWVFAGWGAEDPARWGRANVRCLGALDHRELAPWYALADLLVLPSRGEGFPLVVQESMACGTPALLASETVDGNPGIAPVAYASDLRPEALRDNLRRILADRASLEAMRVRVADHARRAWSWERSAAAYGELFSRLVQGTA